MILIPIFILCIISIIKYKEIINPISIVSVWWGGWLWISTLSLTGIDIPSAMTQFFVISMLSGFAFGALLPTRTKPNDCRVKSPSIFIIKKYVNLFTYVSLICIPVSLYFLSESIGLMSNMADISAMRGLAFGGAIWGNEYILLLYHITVVPCMSLGIIAGPLLYFIYNIKRVLLCALILTISYAFTMHGRFIFLELLFSTVMSLIIIRKLNLSYKKSEVSKRANNVTVFIIVIMVASFALVSTLRSSFDTVGSEDSLKEFMVAYHTTGFVLFDQDLNNPKSTLNTHYSLGFGSIGGLTDISTKIMRRLVSDYTFIPLDTEEDHFDFRIIGQSPTTGYMMYSNAFFTFLYTFYKDLRYFGIVFIPIIIGYITSKSYFKMKYNINSAIQYLIAMYVMIFSIYMSPLEGMSWWITIIIVYLIGKRIKFGEISSSRLKLRKIDVKKIDYQKGPTCIAGD